MPSFSNWLTTTLAQQHRADDAWQRIQEKPTSVVLKRNGSDLTAQTVRLEMDSTVQRNGSQVADVDMQRIVVFGVKGHETVADTNIQRGDRLVAYSTQWEIDLVVVTFGEVQGIGRRVG